MPVPEPDPALGHPEMQMTTRHLLRALVLGVALVALGALITACPDNTLRSLDPEFLIIWPEEDGFNGEEFDASNLSFGQVTTGDIEEIPITISNPGTANLDFCGTYLAVATFDDDGALASETVVDYDPEIASSGPGEMTLENGQAVDFQLRFTPLYGSEIQANLYLVVKHELNYSCRDDSGPGLYIPILGEGFGDPIPDIHSKPLQVEFDDVEVGDSSIVQEVRVTNLGPGLLEIGNVGLADPTHFSLEVGDVPNAQLEQGDSAIMSVQFVPTAEGQHSTEVLIDSNDPDEDPFAVLLIGTANGTPIGKGPQAVCGADYDSAPFETEYYDGTDSFDPDGLTLTYQWVLTPPPGSAATLNSYTTAGPSILLDLAGDYTAELTVTNTNGQTDSCDQTITAIPNENFRIELYWGVPDDMDLHLLRPDSQGGGTPHDIFGGGDCFYANMNPDWGVTGVGSDDPSLDLDDIPGTGPENINIVDPAMSPYDGWYEVFVHDYPSTEIYQPANDVTVNIYLNGGLAQTYNFQMSGEDSDYYVAKIHWPTGNIQACNGLGGCP